MMRINQNNILFGTDSVAKGDVAVESDIAIKVENLSKLYKLYLKPFDRLKESLHWNGRKYHQDFHALNNISFEIKRGETFGIIGNNGSGKSTLLKIIAGVLTPSSGDVVVNGRVSALLELGAGFNPEYTGIENIYFQGSLMGISREDMNQRINAIIKFAEIAEFIDQPVKTYSSGMFARLAFAVAINVDPDILIVDEALSVGDIFFRQKCYKQIESLLERGTTVLLVTHSMNEIEQFCKRGIFLEHGKLKAYGLAGDIVRYYYLSLSQDSSSFEAIEGDTSLSHVGFSESVDGAFWPSSPEFFINILNVLQVSDGFAKCISVAISDVNCKPCRSFKQGDTAVFYYEFLLLKDINTPIGGLNIQNDKGIIVHGKNSMQYGSSVPSKVKSGSTIRFIHKIDLDIACGEYTFEIGIVAMNSTVYENRKNLTHEELDSKTLRLCHLVGLGPILVNIGYKSEFGQLKFHGVSNLAGSMNVVVKNN